MSNEELLPCPFCGGADIAISVDENQGNKWGSAVCFSCSAVGPEVRTGYETHPEASWRAEAAAEWNRRASPPEDVKRMREALENIASSEPNGLWAQQEAVEALASKETER